MTGATKENKMAGLPLEGIRVVELTQIYAGPYATMNLADWGAEVIRVETITTLRPGTRGQYAVVPPELAEQAKASRQALLAFPDWDPSTRPWNRHAGFTSTGRNKKSMTVDLTNPEGLEILGRLIETADAFIENNVPETMDKLKISYEWMKELNPDIITVRMPAYGLSGPYANYRSLGLHVDGVTGLAQIKGHPDEPHSRRGDTVAPDAAAGMAAAFAILAAIWHRRKTGKGQLIEMPLAENYIPMLAEPLLEYEMTGRVPGAIGNRDKNLAPHGVYPCKGEDNWLIIAVAKDAEWRGLCAAMGNTELALDPRFADGLSRHANQDVLDEIISAWTLPQEHRELLPILQAQGVPAGPVLNELEILEDPHLAERGYYEPLDHPEMGVYKYHGPLWHMSKTPNHLRTPPPLLGEHNEYVYKEILNTSDDEYARLESEGHIGMDMLPNVP